MTPSRGTDYDNVLVGGAGNDMLTGGCGNDTYIFADGWGNDTFFEEPDSGNDEGQDTLDFSAVTTNLLFQISAEGSLAVVDTAGNTLSRGYVDETTYGYVENLTASSGVNTLNYALYTNPVIVDLTVGEATGFYAISGFRHVVGTAYDDTITGNDQDNILTGAAGDDILSGGPGTDTLDGGAGTDTVVETRDADFILTDTLLMIGGQTDVLSSIESAELTGGDSANRLDAYEFTAGPVVLDGGAGDDTLIGGAGDDTLTGGPGIDFINGWSGTNTLVESADTRFVLTNATLDMAEGPSEMVSITLTGVSAGDFTLTFEGETTQLIPYDAEASQVEAALAMLPNIGEDNVVVSGDPGAWTVTFRNTLGGMNLADMTGAGNFPGGSLGLVVTDGARATNFFGFVQIVCLTGDSDNLLNASAFTDGSVILDGGAGDDILIGGYGDDTLTGGPGIDSIDGRSGTNTLVESANTRFILTDTTLDMAEGPNETVTITLTGVTGGDFTLTFEGETTEPIAFNAEPWELRAILTMLPNIGADNVLVSGTPGAWTVTFTNTLGGKDLTNMTGAGNFSRGSMTLEVTDGQVRTNALAKVQIAHLTGGNSDNLMDASAFSGSVVLDGDAGNDTLIGSDSSDTLTPTHVYADNGMYTVTLTVADDDGDSGSDTFMVTVGNMAPVIDELWATSADENGVVRLTGTYSDAGTLDTHTLTIDWGEDTPQMVAVSSGSFYITHQYLDDNPTGTPSDAYTIAVTLTDDDTGSDTASTSATITNVTPVLTLDPVATINENGIATLTGTIVDPGTLDTFTLDINWGDPLSPNNAGQYVLGPGATGSQTFTLTHQYLDGNPSGTVSDVYTIFVTVTDDDGGVSSNAATVRVENVAPTVEAGSDCLVNEGEAVAVSALFTDIGSLDTHTAVIDWGDGIIETGVLDRWAGTVTASHVYADNRTYTIAVAVTDDDASAADTLSVIVNNVAPTVEAGPDQAVYEGQWVSLVPVTFNDLGTQDTHTAMIDWGDGIVEPGIVTEAPFGPPGSALGADGTVGGSHVYADNGTYTVTAAVTDDDGASTSNSFTVTVLNMAPTVEAATDKTVNEGELLELDPAVFNDPGTLDTHTATINWGDGIVESGTVTETPFGPPGSTSGADGIVSGNHVYADNGTYTIAVTVTDDEGASTSDTLTVTVLNVAPAVNVVPEQDVQYSDPIDVSITATDVPADTMNASVSYSVNGDGFIEGLPDDMTISGGLAFSGASDQAELGTWTLSGIADLAPGSYTIRVTVSDEEGGSTDVDIALNVLREDAFVTYNGVEFVSTPSISESTAVVELRATIQDITAVHPVSDPNPGNITAATVTFVDLDNRSVIAADLPVELLDSDMKTGIVSYEWVVNIGNSDSLTFMIGVYVGGFGENFTGNYSGTDTTVITVSKPVQNSIIGGGHIINEYSAGVFAGDTGLKTNFGFNVKFNKKLTNLQGRVNIITRQGERVYQVKTTAIQSLAINPKTGEIIFVSKANLIDITDPDNPISIAGNLALLISLTDSKDPTIPDSIGITLWNGNELWFSSNWTGTETIEQYLAAGNLAVRK